MAGGGAGAGGDAGAAGAAPGAQVGGVPAVDAGGGAAGAARLPAKPGEPTGGAKPCDGGAVRAAPDAGGGAENGRGAVRRLGRAGDAAAANGNRDGTAGTDAQADDDRVAAGGDLVGGCGDDADIYAGQLSGHLPPGMHGGTAGGQRVPLRLVGDTLCAGAAPSPHLRAGGYGRRGAAAGAGP